MSEDIKFSTSGFRAVIAEGLTAQSVQRLAFGIADHVLENSFYGFEGSGYLRHCQAQGKSPKKPHLKPKPRALDVSGSNESEASFSCNLARASLRDS